MKRISNTFAVLGVCFMLSSVIFITTPRPNVGKAATFLGAGVVFAILSAAAKEHY